MEASCHTLPFFPMSTPDPSTNPLACTWVDERHWQQSAERKAYDRAALAALDPREAQALVSSLPPLGRGEWQDVTPPDRWCLGEDLAQEQDP